MTASSPDILNDTILSNGSMAVLAGDPYTQVTAQSTYYGFQNLQLVVVSANNSPVTLNQSAGNLSFASSGDSPNKAVPDGNGQDQGDETQGGGTLQGLSNGDVAVVTWGDYNHNYDLQILNSSGGVVTAPFVLANSLPSGTSAGNPSAVIATNGSEFVVAWNTDDITGLYFERFSLTGAAIGGVVTVKTPSALNPATGTGVNENNNSQFNNSLAIDLQGNVVLGFGSEDIYHSGYFNEYNNSNTKIVGTPSSPQLMGSGAIRNQEQAPRFAPIAGGGFITTGYTASGTYNNSNATWSGTFTLNVQEISTSGSVTTVATVTGISGAVEDRSTSGDITLSNGLVAFQEDANQTGDQAANDWDTFNPSNNTLTRDAFSVTPGADNGNPSSYSTIPYPIANVSGGGLATVSVNSSNQLVASGLDVTVVAAPVVTAGGTVTFDGGGSAVTLDSGLTVSDTGSSTLASATVTITGFISGDTLSVGTAGGLSVGYSSGVLTLSGTASLATYQAALESVTYSFSPSNGDPTGGGSNTSRTISWVVNDGTSNSNTGSSTLDTVHEAPSVTAGGTVNYEIGASTASILDSGATASDVDSGGDLAGATVMITAGTFKSGDVSHFTAQNGISGVYSAGTLTLSGAASIANYHTALDSITFSTTSTTSGNRTIDWSINDGSTSNGSSSTATSTVDVTPAPVVTAGATVTFDGGGPATTLDSGLTITDLSSATLAGATVTITAGTFVSGDALNFTAQNGITGVYSSGTLTLSGTTTLANYQTALELITYSFTSNGDPTGGGSHTSRTINWVVSDGTASSATATSTVNTVHEPPVVTAGASINYEVTALAATLDSGLALSDPDSGGLLTGVTVTIGGFQAGDTLSWSTTGLPSITGVYDSATGTLVLSGSDTLADYQAVLRSVGFSATAVGTGSRTINWTANDGVETATGSSAVDVTGAPSVTAGATATFNGGGAAVALDSTLTVTDPSNTTLASATVQITAGTFLSGDALNFVDQNNITGSYDSTTGVLTLTGTDTLANYQTALESITYSFTGGGDPTGGGSQTSRTIDWVVNDGAASSATATSVLGVTHAAPVVTASGTVNYEVGATAAVTVDSGLGVTDADSGGNLIGATVSIGGFVVGDMLSFTNTASITGTYNSNNGTLTLSGSDTVTDYATALDSVTFSSSSTTTGDRTITWTVNDGNTINGLASGTSTVDVVAGPVVTIGGGATPSFSGGGAPVTADSLLTVTDPNSTTLTSATVSIVNSTFLSGDALNFTNQNNITGSYDSTTGVLTLSGQDSLANYQTALETITYSFTGNADLTNDGDDISRTLSWVINDGTALSAPVTSTVSVSHTPPLLIAGATTVFTGGGSAVVLDGGLSVTDPNSGGNLRSATVLISSGFVLGGDVLNFTNQNGITGSYNSNNGTLLLSGTATIADYVTALESVTYSFSPSDGDPTIGGTNLSRGIQWIVTDGVSPANATSTVDITHAPPVVTAGATAQFELTSVTPSLLDFGLMVSDPDSDGELTGATVSIGTGFASGDDVLVFTNQNGITGSYNSPTGVMTLTGLASVADYQTALASIEFGAIAVSGNRTINWSVSDGGTINGTGTATSTVDVTTPAPSSAPYDFNASGNSDVLILESDGSIVDWTMSGAVIDADQGLSFQGASPTLPATDAIAGIGDFTGDGDADILVSTAIGGLTEWQMSGATITSALGISSNGAPVDLPSSWSIIGAGDFNGDGKDDILLLNTNGTMLDWTMNGNVITANQGVTYQGSAIDLPSTSTIAGIGDFTGNGMSDILVVSADGEMFEWQMNGNVIAADQPVLFQNSAVELPSSLSVVGVADFTATGRSDILLENSSNQLLLFTMNGNVITAIQSVTSQGTPMSVPTGYSIAEIGDFNGDGIADILLRGPDGSLIDWQMNGPAIASAQGITLAGVSAGMLPAGSLVEGNPTTESASNSGAASGSSSGGTADPQVIAGGHTIDNAIITDGTLDLTPGAIADGIITFAAGSTGTLLDADQASMPDTIMGFSEGSTHLSFAGENLATEAQVVTSAQLVNGNTVLSFPDHTSVVLLGVGHVDTGIFA